MGPYGPHHFPSGEDVKVCTNSPLARQSVAAGDKLNNVCPAFIYNQEIANYIEVKLHN